jgi:hypothetical protein
MASMLERIDIPCNIDVLEGSLLGIIQNALVVVNLA